MQIEFDNEDHFGEFIRLNELWIREHFQIEEADKKLAANPAKVVADGGCILSLVDNDHVVAVCALFKGDGNRYELARMAVAPSERRKGYGNAVLEAALAEAERRKASSVYLMSNTILTGAIELYKRHGFEVVAEGPHPDYARCNIVMERLPK